MDGVSRYWRLGISRILARPFWKELKDFVSRKMRPNPEKSIKHVLFRAQRAYTMNRPSRNYLAMCAIQDGVSRLTQHVCLHMRFRDG
mmetsp:Transcript_11346/g.36183  ORF Transcript_11346/g.36183 Transcript_11346/m.36183 type:complete len:87 (+) Transcript_11346:888-1148(+)